MQVKMFTLHTMFHFFLKFSVLLCKTQNKMRGFSSYSPHWVCLGCHLNETNQNVKIQMPLYRAKWFLNIGAKFTEGLFIIHEYILVNVLEILVKGALTFAHAVKPRRRKGPTPLPEISLQVYNGTMIYNGWSSGRKKEKLFFCFVFHGVVAV